MSCPHATTKTLLWLYENQEPDHIEHISTCAECESVIAEHTDVMAVINPVLPNLGQVPMGSLPVSSEQSIGRAPYVTWSVISIAVAAMAAMWMLTVPPTVSPADTGMHRIPADKTAMAVEDWMDPGFDDELDALNSELNDLSIELLTL